MQDNMVTYRARVQQVTFNYPSGWVPMMEIETGPLGQEEFGRVEIPGTARPSMAYFSTGKPTTIDKEAIEPERDIEIVSTTEVTIPNWTGPVRYVEGIIDNGDGSGFWVMYGLASPNDLINEVRTVRSRQDILPLILKDASTPNPGEGLLAFFGTVFGFISKPLAQEFFKDPTYQQVKAMMLSTAFLAPPEPAPSVTLPNGQTLGAAPGTPATPPAPADTPAVAPAPLPEATPEAPAPAAPEPQTPEQRLRDVASGTPGSVTQPGDQPGMLPTTPPPDDDPTTLRIPR